MIEQPPPGMVPDLPQLPPLNRAQGCFRLLLWFMPTVFAVASAWAIAAKIGRSSELATALWIIVNLGFIGAAGWFNAAMPHHIRLSKAEKKAGKMAVSMVVFFLVQLVLIPAIVAGTVFAFCALVAR